MGLLIGENLYLATDGDGASAALFGGILVGVLVLLVGGGVWLDRRRRTRQDDAPGPG